MKKLFIVICIALATYSFLITSCKKDEKLVLSKEIQNIVPDSTLNKIISLGMPVNKGTNPPELINIFKVSPFTLKATNVKNDFAIGYKFADYKFRLYDQDNEKLTIKLDYVNGPETGTGFGGFMSGNGNDFSVFVKVHSLNGNNQAEILQIISGTITADGIKNFYLSNFMLDNYGNPNHVWIDEETGRVIYDSDGVSPVALSLQDKSADKLPGVSASAGVDKK
jgi:hypothetical protein